MYRRYRAAPTVTACLAVTLLVVGCATTRKEPPLTQQQRQLNIESFEHVWTTIHDEYWDPEFDGLDWPAVRHELRPKIEQAAVMSEARAVMRDMISRLELSHFAIIPADVYKDLDQPAGESPQDGATGIDVRVIDGHALVTSVLEGSPADQLGVRTGWEVIRVGQRDIVSTLERLMHELEDDPSKPSRLARAIGPHTIWQVGNVVALAFLDGDDRTVELDIPLAERRGRKVRFGNLGDIRVWIDVRTVDGNIGYIAFNGFFNPPYLMKSFNDGMRSFMDADGVIIDLRGNPGGMGAMAMGMAGWFVEEDRHLGTLRMRDNELKLIIQARATTYDGPLVVLVDGLSGSASEFLASGLQELNRACVVGSRTKGEALPGQFTTLPNGDVFLYATANFVSGGGKTLEGVGVIPDIEVHLTRAALLQGRDPALEAAIAWIRNQQ
ncbi:MAG TPA: S41 family peptidase [Phycisphaerae bacterium]|nr:S41 family peptidase [Phycisphaerae bacterium]